MTKTRINELARELEVKPGRIIELLPELGVTEKKTHSSSIDDDVARSVRRHFGFEVEEPPAPAGSTAEKPPAAGEETTSDGPQAVSAASAAGMVQAEPEVVLTATMETVSTATEDPAVPSPISRAAQPLRPPLALAGQPRLAVSAAPGAPVAKTTTIPARPIPTPRPGQILTGPRQPLPGPVPRVIPALARQAVTLPGTPRPAPPPPPPPLPAAPPPEQPKAQMRNGALAGQPAARPVVPPRADIVARLQQTQPRIIPGQPMAPRPGPPRPQVPTPGQPIYQGRVRPGQALTPRTGPPPGAPSSARFPRGRAMHPTTTARAVDPTAPAIPTEVQRRDAGKKTGRQVVRQKEEPEGRLRYKVRKVADEPLPAANREITISEGITVKELSEKLGVKANLVIKKLVEKKIFATINQNLDAKLAEQLARDFGASTNQLSFEEEAAWEIEMAEDPKALVKRAPVVTIMGHVDHGKTSLLDAIRMANVAEHEAGGITQHIGAYYVEKNGRKIVFIDTPGHAAFTRMRARGAKVTDVVILVVAADDGVMPQTLEAIDHARAAKVPIIVAINKIDKPDAQPERVRQQLADRGVLAEEWGGDTVMVPVSAKARQGLDLLLEMILLVADMRDFKANPTRPALGNVLEAQLDRGRGPVATVLVRNGTLRVSDYFICGSVFGKVRAMFDDRGNPLREAEPSMPVEVLGLESMPEVGDIFQVVIDTAKAKQIVLYREAKSREETMARSKRMSLDQFHARLEEGEIKELNIILKTDVGGTAEVLSDTLQKLSSDKVRIRVMHAGVGAITETDVLLASASEAIIVGFNVRPERMAQAVADREKVDIRLHTIIYELVDEIKRAMAGLLDPVYKEVHKGRVEVRDTFRISKVGVVAGCYVQDGVVTRDSQVRLLRDNIVVHTGRVDSLRRFKNDASEVKSGFECGLTLANYSDVKPGDIIECFATERVASEVLV